ncbi:MAG TPA: hypothetical protein VKU38_23410 [Ktedonobacteraceae bacterium]|nr:hypothetical protein [Ktedonobacteraceae bacterium]
MASIILTVAIPLEVGFATGKSRKSEDLYSHFELYRSSDFLLLPFV